MVDSILFHIVLHYGRHGYSISDNSMNIDIIKNGVYLKHKIPISY